MDTTQRNKLIQLLSNGGKYSAIQISNILYIGDARSVIRNARNDGYLICDEWKKTLSGKGRYKLYFMKPQNEQ